MRWRAPDDPTDLPAKSWFGVLRRTVTEFKGDNVTDWAAALTYYAILAIFPALIVLVSSLGLAGSSATQPLLDNLATVAPGPARDVVEASIKNLESSGGAAGVLFVVGLAAALWSSSGYVAAFMRASNAIYDIGEGRPIWKTLPVRVGLTVALLVLVGITAVGVVLTGGLANSAGDLIGLGSTAVTVWEIAKWPVLLLVVSFMFALLYWAAPNVKQPGFKWLTPGSVLAVLVWVAASAGFALYVASFGSYNKTYGALGGIIVFLVWLWLTNIAVLLGAELNAELERGRRLEAGATVEAPLGRAARHAQARRSGGGHTVSVQTEPGRADGTLPSGRPWVRLISRRGGFVPLPAQEPGRHLRAKQAAHLAEPGPAARALLGCQRHSRAVDGQPARGAIQIRQLSSSRRAPTRVRATAPQFGGRPALWVGRSR